MFKLNANGTDAPSAPAREIGSNRRDWKYFDEKLGELRTRYGEYHRARAASNRSA
jgi:hypothetical protein